MNYVRKNTQEIMDMNMKLKKSSQLHLFLNLLLKSMRFKFKKVNSKLKFNCPFNFKKAI